MKTIICDIDGTLTKYMGGGHKAIMKQDHELLPGVLERMRMWECAGHRIILITGRRESVRERTESELRRLGVPFDILLMGYADSGRILINDISPHVGAKAHVVNVERDAGWKYYDWGSVGLDNLGK
jgi:3-deoxy-D-manno-octulosonate 8-phosphate phosphatase KdsC-like HAD superfamily phosphatase